MLLDPGLASHPGVLLDEGEEVDPVNVNDESEGGEAVAMG
jgi:hypothetical protein